MNDKLSRNTDLRLALGETDKREEWEQFYERYPTLRVRHVSQAIRQRTPLRSRNSLGGDGFSGFQVTADGRSYTVVVVADDPTEWTIFGIHTFRSWVQSMLDPMAVHHILALSQKAARSTHTADFDV